MCWGRDRFVSKNSKLEEKAIVDGGWQGSSSDWNMKTTIGIKFVSLIFIVVLSKCISYHLSTPSAKRSSDFFMSASFDVNRHVDGLRKKAIYQANKLHQTNKINIATDGSIKGRDPYDKLIQKLSNQKQPSILGEQEELYPSGSVKFSSFNLAQKTAEQVQITSSLETNMAGFSMSTLTQGLFLGLAIPAMLLWWKKVTENSIEIPEEDTALPTSHANANGEATIAETKQAIRELNQIHDHQATEDVPSQQLSSSQPPLDAAASGAQQAVPPRVDGFEPKVITPLIETAINQQQAAPKKYWPSKSMSTYQVPVSANRFAVDVHISTTYGGSGNAPGEDSSQHVSTVTSFRAPVDNIVIDEHNSSPFFEGWTPHWATLETWPTAQPPTQIITKQSQVMRPTP